MLWVQDYLWSGHKMESQRFKQMLTCLFTLAWLSSMFALCSIFLMWRAALLPANRPLNEWGGWDWRWRITLDRLFSEPYSTSSQLHYNFIHCAQVTIILPLTWFKCLWEQRRLLSYSLQMEGHNSITLPKRNWFLRGPTLNVSHTQKEGVVSASIAVLMLWSASSHQIPPTSPFP